MAWIDGTVETVLEVKAPAADVVDFFCDPAEFQAAFSQMEKSEEIETGTWKWTLKEKSEKGIKFQAIYTVKYVREENVLTWETIDGNMKSSGRTEVLDKGDHAVVNYKETISTSLPIPKLMTKVFRPIVQREVDKGIDDFLTRAKAACES